MTRRIGPDANESGPADQAALARARPFRLIQAVSAADAVAGMLLHYKALDWGPPGEVLGLPIFEFVGYALIAIGVTGYVLFEFLKRAAMRRTGTPPPLR
jgi:hypothetical protein